MADAAPIGRNMVPAMEKRDRRADPPLGMPVFTTARTSGVPASRIASALVRFQLQDDDPAIRRTALAAIARGPDASHLAALMRPGPEPDPGHAARRDRLVRLLTIVHGETTKARVQPTPSFAGDPGVDVRAALNPLVTTRWGAGGGAARGQHRARVAEPVERAGGAELHGAVRSGEARVTKCRLVDGLARPASSA